MSIDSLPAIYTPGLTYDFEVVTRGRDMRRAGFQLSVRFAAGSSAGQQAGTLTSALDPRRTQFARDTSGTTVYLEHTLEGTQVARPGETRWRVRWTAPRSMDSVVFHAASVIASDDNSPLDDEVRTTFRTLGAGIP